MRHLASKYRTNLYGAVHSWWTNDEGSISMRHLATKEQINFVRHLRICYWLCVNSYRLCPVSFRAITKTKSLSQTVFLRSAHRHRHRHTDTDTPFRLTNISYNI